MLLFFAIAAGLVALYLLAQTVRPLLESGVVTAAEWQRVEDESLQLLERRDQLLAELQELEFEAALHKIDARDLEALRTRYALEAVELDKRIDARREQYDGRIEAQVEETLADAAARRRSKAQASAPSTDAAGGARVTREESTVRAEPAAPEPPAAEPAAPEPASAKAAPAAGRDVPADGGGPVDDAGGHGDADGPRAALILAPGEAWDDPAHCARCDNRMAPGSAFCDGCGAPVMRACASCGAANRMQARFCKSCGNPVSGEVAS